jgi:hypothetical protein
MLIARPLASILVNGHFDRVPARADLGIGSASEWVNFNRFSEILQ